MDDGRRRGANKRGQRERTRHEIQPPSRRPKGVHPPTPSAKHPNAQRTSLLCTNQPSTIFLLRPTINRVFIKPTVLRPTQRTKQHPFKSRTFYFNVVRSSALRLGRHLCTPNQTSQQKEPRNQGTKRNDIPSSTQNQP